MKRTVNNQVERDTLYNTRRLRPELRISAACWETINRGTSLCWLGCIHGHAKCLSRSSVLLKVSPPMVCSTPLPFYPAE